MTAMVDTGYHQIRSSTTAIPKAPPESCWSAVGLIRRPSNRLTPSDTHIVPLMEAGLW